MNMRQKNKKIIIIIAVCLLTAIAIAVAIFIFALNATTTLSKLYDPKSEILTEAGYNAEILNFEKDIDEFKTEQQVNFDNAEVKAVIKLESGALLGVEFKSVKSAKKFYSSINYADRTIYRNIVMFSSAEYMSGLLMGKIKNVNGNFIFTDKKSKTRILIRAGETLADEIDVIGFRAFSQSGASKIIIPPSVTKISRQAFFVCRNLTDITFADNSILESISDEAFFGCINLTEIFLPSGVSKVGKLAFWGNENLHSVKFGGALKELGDGAFYGCVKLENIEFTAGGNYFVDDGVLYCRDYTLIKMLQDKQTIAVKGGIKAIGYGAFEKKTKLQKVTSENQSGIKIIGDKAFENCINLSSCELFGELEFIGEKAFLNTKVNAVYLNEGLKEIGESAFRQTNLKEVTLPASLEKLGNYAFNDCSYLRKIIVGGLLGFEVGEQVFDGIYRLFVGSDEVKECFSEYKNFTYFTTQIVGDYAVRSKGDSVVVVQYLGDDKDVIIPSTLDGKNVASIGKNAFSKLHFIESISCEVGSNLTELEDNAVEGCQNLSSVRLPYGFKTLGVSSLRSNPKLKSVTLPTTLTAVGAFALDNTLWLNDRSGEVIIGDGILYKFKSDSIDAVLSKNVKTIGDRAFISNKNIKRVTLPDSVRIIDNYAFSGCTNLEKVVLNDGLLQINILVFGGCESLKSITVPSSVYYIGYGAFYKSYLTRINMEAQTPCSIGGDVFAFPQNPEFKIYASGESICGSSSGVCSHTGGKTKCYKHANGWAAYRKLVEAA